jgi:hypothetical protein
MKQDMAQWRTLFEPVAQCVPPATRSEQLCALRFSVPDDWTTLSRSETLSYFLSPDEESSISVQCITPETTDGIEAHDILTAFVEGMQQELDAYHPVYQRNCTGKIGTYAAYGFRYTVTVRGQEIPNSTVLFLVGQHVYCISFADQNGTKGFSYAIALLESLSLGTE